MEGLKRALDLSTLKTRDDLSIPARLQVMFSVEEALAPDEDAKFIKVFFEILQKNIEVDEKELRLLVESFRQDLQKVGQDFESKTVDRAKERLRIRAIQYPACKVGIATVDEMVDLYTELVKLALTSVVELFPHPV